MRLLLLTPQLPYPPHKGTTLRNFHLIRGLAANHEVHLLSFVERPDELEEAEELRRLCRRIETVLAPQRAQATRILPFLFSSLPDMALRLPSAEYSTLLIKLTAEEGYDLVQVEGLELARYLSLVKRRGGPRVVFDEHNAEYLLQRRAFQIALGQPRQWLGGFYSLVQWQKLRRYERRACHQADLVLAVSKRDGVALQRLDPGLRVEVIPNGVDTEYFRPGSEAPDAGTLVFAGTMDFRPNVDAMVWFCRQVLPHLRRRRPEVRLFIVGRSPSPAVRRLAGPGVTVTGAVEDVRPYLRRAAVYVVPLRFGGGTRFKVLEALAAGVPVVSTHLGAEGISVRDGQELLLADGAEEFAARLAQLLSNPALGASLAERGRALVEREYDWRVIVPRLEEAYRGLA